ncbi:hypothetical protein HYPBUDRAFT_158417 [Hyphopichia burtonii NRRL Y-1933]|uniref:Fork-head domain-containing protein n=1 Tax=Hyphopichia burtonii NRRL Y-1933 TaxID=984485 RepID=A0A1E4REM5_9ASCO|nr:hypothetical protein HYPBUDRAFT_158417 [Hyphopichia burtonii NRRL Y-1933]ODV65565.1 hypothetical protein HYPBUDRAFT_158417 [Hyphopichia burtonii NRRL Y-1933]
MGSSSRLPLQEKVTNAHVDEYKYKVTDTPVSSYKNKSKINTPPQSIHITSKNRTNSMLDTPINKSVNGGGNQTIDKQELTLLSPAFSSPQNSYFDAKQDDSRHHQLQPQHYMAMPPPKPSFELEDAGKEPSSSNSLTVSIGLDDNERPLPKKKQKKPKELKESGFSIESDEKPPYSYATLIGMSILTTKSKKLTLSSIYQWISDTFKYYKREDVGWQNSIRHNLSLNKAFIKGDKSKDGKGHYWCIKPGFEEQFLRSRNNKKSGYHEIMDQLKKYPNHPNYPTHHFGERPVDIEAKPIHRSINSIPSSPNLAEDEDEQPIKKRNRSEIDDDFNYRDSDDDETNFNEDNDHKYSRAILDHPFKKQKLVDDDEDYEDDEWETTKLITTPKSGKNHPNFIISESPNKPLLAGKNLTFTSSFSCQSNFELSPIRTSETGPLLEPLTPANNNYKSSANVIQIPPPIHLNHSNSNNHLHPHYSLSQYHHPGQSQPPSQLQHPLNNLKTTPKSNIKTPLRILKTPQTSSIMKRLWNSPSYLDDFYYSPLLSSSHGALNSYDDDDMIMRAFESPANNQVNQKTAKKNLSSSIDSSRNLFDDLKKIDSLTSTSSIDSTEKKDPDHHRSDSNLTDAD